VGSPAQHVSIPSAPCVSRMCVVIRNDAIDGTPLLLLFLFPVWTLAIDLVKSTGGRTTSVVVPVSIISEALTIITSDYLIIILRLSCDYLMTILKQI